MDITMEIPLQLVGMALLALVLVKAVRWALREESDDDAYLRGLTDGWAFASDQKYHRRCTCRVPRPDCPVHGNEEARER